MKLRMGLGRRGSVAVVLAVMAVPLIGFTGFGIDAGRLWLVRARLQSAVDGAALLAAKEIGSGRGPADAAGLFWSGFGRTAQGSHVGFLGAAMDDPAVASLDPDTVRVSVQGSLPTVFMGVLGIPTMEVSAAAAARRTTEGLELALVLDNTGSMKGAPIAALRQSATDLVNILYGTGSNDTRPNLWVAVVPFTAEVNLGASHRAWLAPGSLDESAYGSAGWAGCVFARHAGGHDADDAPPSAARFTPFLWPSTLGHYGAGVPGDNDWSPGRITEANQASLPDNTAVGPNLGCDALAVHPLDRSRKAALSVIGAMAQTYRGGTFINLGLQAGWFTLSPRWRGLWGDPASPLPYGTKLMRKAIVLMTDGNNDWYSWPGGAPDNRGDADVTGYDRFSRNVLGLAPYNPAAATAAINASMSTMCRAIKAAGIDVYTILFNHDAISADTQALFLACASSADKYFLAPTGDDLRRAFARIADQLSTLRLVQ